MMDKFLSTLDRIDQTLSKPIQFLSLPAPIERVIGFPTGEFIFTPPLLPLLVLILAFVEFALGVNNVFPSGISVLGFSSAVMLFLKLVAIRRRRPEPEQLKTPTRSIDVRTFARKAGDMDSFPSGCALIGTVMCYFATLWTGSSWPLAVVVPMCCFVRVYFCCHWLGDTLGGVIFGAGVVALIVKFSGGDIRDIGWTHPLFLMGSVLFTISSGVLFFQVL